MPSITATWPESVVEFGDFRDYLLINQTPGWVLAISILNKLPWGFLLCTKI